MASQTHSLLLNICVNFESTGDIRTDDAGGRRASKSHSDRSFVFLPAGARPPPPGAPARLATAAASVAPSILGGFYGSFSERQPQKSQMTLTKSLLEWAREVHTTGYVHHCNGSPDFYPGTKGLAGPM